MPPWKWTPSFTLADPRSAELAKVSTLRGVGPSLSAKLAQWGVETLQDLLFLLPLRYEDRTHVIAIGSLSPGDRAVVEGTVQLAEVAGGALLTQRRLRSLSFASGWASSSAAVVSGVGQCCATKTSRKREP